MCIYHAHSIRFEGKCNGIIDKGEGRVYSIGVIWSWFMGQVPSRARHLESVISICLLGVLILIGAGIYLQQSKYNAGAEKAALAEPETKNSEPVPPAETSPFTPTGFEALSKPESYDADNLYEKIDGKAPLYTEAGFKGLTTQRFVKTGDANLWMEVYIYDMGDIKNAFCVYSEQRREGTEGLTSMRFGYKTSNGVYFVHGKYYIEIVGSSESGELSEAMAEAEQKITANLATGINASIAELAFFPQQNLIPDSFKLYLVSAFGCEKLTDVFTARYKAGDETITAFVSKRADAKEAEATAESYRKFLIENGATAKNTTNEPFVGKVMDLYGATEIVFTAGLFVGGVHEAEDQQSAEKLAEILFNKLDSLKNE
jgi:hypothetical protein